MDIKAKLRPFYVAKMLYEQTDEDHYLTIAQIMEQLEKDYGISTSRGTVGDDIKALQELGVEIEVVPQEKKRETDQKVRLSFFSIRSPDPLQTGRWFHCPG